MTVTEILTELTNVENQLNSEQIEDAKSDLNLLIHNLENLNEVDIPGFEGTMDKLDNLVNLKIEAIEINGC